MQGETVETAKQWALCMEALAWWHAEHSTPVIDPETVDRTADMGRNEA